MVAAGIALDSSTALTNAVTLMCSVRKCSPGTITAFLRQNNIVDAVQAAVLRKKQKARTLSQTKPCFSPNPTPSPVTSTNP